MSLRKVQFGAYELDSASGELRKNGIKIKLQEQPLQVLQQLLEHPGEVVTREELQKRIWPVDTFVDFDHGLYSAVQRLRDALGDTADGPRYIETLPKRGYRFIAVVNNGNGVEAQAPSATIEVPAIPVPKHQAPSRGYRTTMFVGAGITFAALVIALTTRGGIIRERLLWKPEARRMRSIAVLPLQNLSSDPSQEYFADGMTDALITDLAQISSLKVVSRTSTLRYKKSDKTLPEIARELNVDGIVEGTVQRSGDRVRVTAQLIYGPMDKHVWANSYERVASDVLPMESEMAREIANQIQTKLSPEQAARLANVKPVNLKAFEAYLQGKYHLTQADDLKYHQGKQKSMQSELGIAREYFQTAISEDPNFALGYVGLSKTWFDGSVAEGGPEKEREALQKALQLDPALAEAHRDLGYLEFLRYWNWADSEPEFKRAIELNPNFADAHAGYSDFLDAMGRFEEGMREYLRAQELDPGHYAPEPNPFFTRRQFDKAIEMDQNDITRRAFGWAPHWDLAANYEAKGMHDDAIREWEVALRILGYEDIAKAMQRGFKAGGYKGAFREWARKMEVARAQGANIPSFVPAFVYTHLSDREHAFAWLEKAYKERDPALQGLKVDPTWDNLRADPRFQDLVRRMNFPD